MPVQSDSFRSERITIYAMAQQGGAAQADDGVDSSNDWCRNQRLLKAEDRDFVDYVIRAARAGAAINDAYLLAPAAVIPEVERAFSELVREPNVMVEIFDPRPAEVGMIRLELLTKFALLLHAIALDVDVADEFPTSPFTGPARIERPGDQIRPFCAPDDASTVKIEVVIGRP